METSYFGLKYFETNNTSAGLSSSLAGGQETYNNSRLYGSRGRQQTQACWLDVNKSAIKQLKDVQPMTVYFGVKYYASDPCKLAEEITRYQFFLQCKQDILYGKLKINYELAIELFALAVQSELGDYDPSRHLDGYVSEFQFLPNQSSELEKQVALCHRSLTGQVPATAELNFLERIKWLDLYGSQLFSIQYDDSSLEDYSLGLNPSGVLVLRNKTKVAHYIWPRIVKTKCQGRCFLMDVIDLPQQQQASNNKQLTNNCKGERNRFGFRLVDKDTSHKLRWAIEEHRSFYHLIHSSATLNQLAQRQLHQQQQTLKLSQRFRNSIRSAMNVSGANGANGFSAMHLAAATAAAQQQQQQKLRSSVKSLNVNNLDRQQPTVVRMPSRRYNDNRQQSANNSTGMAHTMIDSQRQQAILMMNQFNQMNGIIGKSQTLKPTSKLSTSQHYNHQSLDPKKNPYYKQFMMMMAQAQAANNNNNNNLQDVSILPPGRHIVQPTIYKASSVVNGINQLAPNAKIAQHQQQQHSQQIGFNAPMMMQFFNTKPQYYNNINNATGYESPKSTKSAIAPSTAMRLASKKLAKQQQQLAATIYNNNNNSNDAQPLLSYPDQSYYSNSNDHHPSMNHYYGYKSANQSPRSVRSARISRHRSKSTNENLHLLHKQQQQQQQQMAAAAALAAAAAVGIHTGNNKMLLATTQQLLNQQHNLIGQPPAPPNYNGLQKQQQQQQADLLATKKRATFALNNEQANILLNTNGILNNRKSRCNKQQRVYCSEEDDDYCCSRSDCSSIIEQQQQQAASEERRKSLGPINQQHSNRQQQRLSLNQAQNRRASSIIEQDQHVQNESWNAIRKRHNEFSNGKGNFNPQCLSLNQQQLLQKSSKSSMINDSRRQPIYSPDNEDLLTIDDNNNSGTSTTTTTNHNQQLIKNISNKQATPILLTMTTNRNNNSINNIDDINNSSSANDKAVQLLNLQRQQLNHSSSSSTESGAVSNKSVSTSSMAGSSTPNSSMASSPPNTNNNTNTNTNYHHQQQSLSSSSTASNKSVGSSISPTNNIKQQTNSSDSTSSATSGYYAGSNNSTGSASADSDSQTTIDCSTNKQLPSSNNNIKKSFNNNNSNTNNDSGWPEEGTRAKIALASYGARMAGDRLLIGGNKMHLNNSTLINDRLDSCESPTLRQRHKMQSGTGSRQSNQKQFYLGDKTLINEGGGQEGHQHNLQQDSSQQLSPQGWSVLNQINVQQQQQAPSSLKYVSFDV